MSNATAGGGALPREVSLVLSSLFEAFDEDDFGTVGGPTDVVHEVAREEDIKLAFLEAELFTDEGGLGFGGRGGSGGRRGRGLRSGGRSFL